MIAKLLSSLAKLLWINELGVLNGIAVIVSIYVHEFGHYFMADALKMKPRFPRFVPFLGAYVKHDATFDDKKAFKVAISGPLIGGIFGLTCFYLDLIFDSMFIHQVALFSLVINLANLIPYALLDGGHIVRSLGLYTVHLVMTVVLIVVALFMELYILLIFGVLGVFSYSYIFSVKDKLVPMCKEDKEFGVFVYVVLVGILGIHAFLMLK